MPESDPGDDGEINDVEEFMREFDNIERDETLIELLGEGYDVNALGDQPVADLLGAWRDDVTSVPVDESRLPSAHTASGRMPPAPTIGGTMSIQEDAEQLRNIASSQDFPTGLLRAADSKFDEIVAQVQNIVGDQSQHLDKVRGAAEIAKDKIDEAIAATMNFEAAIHDAADGHARG